MRPHPTSTQSRRNALVTCLAALLVALGPGRAHALPPEDDTSAKVTILAFSDFQCPFCGRADGTLEKLGSLYGKALNVRFMHNPLSFHGRAMPAAIASEAARRQGQFAAYATKLFANQSTLEDADLERFAAELGLDLKRFKADLTNPQIADDIAFQQRVAAAVGATGTPCFFINGRQLRGAQPIDQFQAIIDDEVALSDAAGRRGPAWLSDRLKANNADLADYMAGVKQPVAPPPTAKVEDTVIYRVTVDEKLDAIRGPMTAPVTLVVFADFQCPFCARHHATLDAIRARYGDKVRIVFKHNPLPFHQDALPASNAALCAKDQGKFWEMHDRLYETGSSLAPEGLEASAKAIGLDLAKWKACAQNSVHQPQIEADMELAGNVMARGTPNTFVNGRKLVGARPLEDFTAAVDDALASAQAKLATGVTPAKLYAELIKDGKVHEVLDAEVHAFGEKDAPMLGKPGAKVHVVVVGDFQCPFCARLAPSLSELVAKYPTQVAVVWKNFPLDFHEQALPAAKAAMCAHEQGKFWPAEAWLFEHQMTLDSDLAGLGPALKLNAKKLTACLGSERPGARIEADLAEVRAADARGTPTVYFNGRKFDGPNGYTLEALSAVVDGLLK